MIYTCTISPSIDYTVYLDELVVGELNRTKEVDYFPGGKGINVSRVLQRLGVRNTAIAFAGGFTGKYIEEFLDAEGVMTDFIGTSEITRINAKIKSDVESEINGPAPTINQAQQEELLVKLNQLRSGDYFVLAGSLTGTMPVAFYRELAGNCKMKGIHLVVDTSGPMLKELVSEQPFLIKPNQMELAELCGVEITNQADAVKYARELVDTGVEHVIVSLGGDGAILVTKDVVLRAKAPIGEVVNTVGAGDSLVAGFLAAISQGKDVSSAFKYGVASGSATAFGVDLCVLVDVEELLDRVIIEQE